MIASIDLYLGVRARLQSVQGVPPTGLDVRILERYINSSIIELVMHSIGGATDIAPLKVQLIKQSLTAGHRVYALDELIKGTRYNGALRLPDFDEDSTEPPSDKFAYIAHVPNEALLVTARELEIRRQNEKIRRPDIKTITLEEYNLDKNNPERYPDKDYAWILESNAHTVAGDNTQNADWSNPYPNTTDTTLRGIKGKDSTGLNELEFQAKVDQIISGKGYSPVSYTLFYYKRPTAVVIDRQDSSLSVDSELPSEVKDDIIDIAVRKISADIGQLVPTYQLKDNEAKQ